jgi:hypothetical protein
MTCIQKNCGLFGVIVSMSSMLNAINAKRSGNIVALEDPIEYVYPQSGILSIKGLYVAYNGDADDGAVHQRLEKPPFY